jgi:predicted aldo/keto reductase-like oxidoreductase
MLYRKLAGERVSQLGFGAMRLPTAGGGIDEREAVSMIRAAIDAGVNYVDTAWPYHNGKSEELVGAALRDGYRDRTLLATKSPVWLMKEEDDFDSILDRQLAKLGTDRIDFYLLHALNKDLWKTCLELDAIAFGERAKKAGKIRHFGFSFHDDAATFKAICDAHDWEFCQIQYNFLDRNEQAGEGGLRYARSRGIGVVVMEPLRGGNLVGPLPAGVRGLYDGFPVRRSSADWALRWVLDDPDVAVVLSGMSARAQLDENLKVASDAAAGEMSDAELALIDSVEAEYRRLIQVGCTGCGYCLPCPSGVNIPRNFAVFNEYYMFEKSAAAKGGYQWVDEGQRADKCVECGQCEELCPQRIEIRKELKRVTAELA